MVETRSYEGHYNENEAKQEAHRLAKEVLQETRSLSNASNYRVHDILEIFVSNLMDRAGVPAMEEMQGEFRSKG